MSVHAGTQCWILDGTPPFLTFALPCTPALLKKHAPKYSFTRASADEGHENTEQIAPQGRLSPCFQRCYLHLFACGRTRKSDPRLNQPESGSLLVDLASSSASDGDALTLDLFHPLLRALLRELRLVVLVEGAADKVVATDRLGVLVLVAFRRPGAHDLTVFTCVVEHFL